MQSFPLKDKAAKGRGAVKKDLAEYLGEMDMKIAVRKLREDAVLPARGSAEAAGADLRACMDEERIELAPGETKLIGTGLSMAVPTGYFGGIFARSGLSVKEGLRPSNCVGVIDSDYRGEVKVALYNDSSQSRVIERGERIAQLLILPYLAPEFEEAEVLDETDRGDGGFGHTGKA